jgi:hypothetical protein
MFLEGESALHKTKKILCTRHNLRSRYVNVLTLINSVSKLVRLLWSIGIV